LQLAPQSRVEEEVEIAAAQKQQRLQLCLEHFQRLQQLFSSESNC
jgi:hypothetical protein